MKKMNYSNETDILFIDFSDKPIDYALEAAPIIVHIAKIMSRSFYRFRAVRKLFFHKGIYPRINFSESDNSESLIFSINFFYDCLE